MIVVLITVMMILKKVKKEEKEFDTLFLPLFFSEGRDYPVFRIEDAMVGLNVFRGRVVMIV